MYINSSKVEMESARRYTSERRQSYGFTAVLSKRKEENEQDGTSMKGNSMKEGGNLKNSEELLQNHFIQMRAVSKNQVSEMEESIEELRERCLQYFFGMILGIRKDFLKEEEVQLNPIAGGIQGESKSISLVQESYYKETENTSFSTEGKVVTSDGREISFQVNVEMSRSFKEYTKKEQKWDIANLCDPLVINLKSAPAGVLDQTFFFDLDADGKKDEISMLEEESGFLAWDKNEDGIINDGKELFGTQNGDGFADLAQYDTDKDGWIDEDDKIFDKLKIWVKATDGKDILYTLKEAGVGAICIQKAETDFSLKNQRNQTNAVIRSTGIFLYENGLAGTIQHVDMAKK